MIGPALFRIGAFAFVALALTATALELLRDQQPDSEPSRSLSLEQPHPKAEGLRRCQTLGTAAATDSSCLRTWAEERERFLKTTPRADRFTLPGDLENAP